MAHRTGTHQAPAHYHDMILFEGRSDLHRLIAPHVKEAIKGGRGLSLITAHPVADKKFLSALVETTRARGKPTVSVHDAGKLLVGSRDPASAFSALWDELERKYAGVSGGWTNIGCFLDEFYDAIRVAIEIERGLNQRSPPADVLCCYDNKGFSALDPKDILELLEQHDNVRFPGAVFSGRHNGHRLHA